MSDKDRVARWRQAMRDQGKEPVTLWLSHEEKLRVEDLAHTARCTTSEVVSQALACYQPETPQRTGNVTDTEQLRGMVHELVLTFLDTELSGRMRPLVQSLATTAPPATRTQTNRNVTVTPVQPETRARKGKETAPVPGAAPFDTSKHRLGELCKRGHNYQETGQSLRKVGNGNCVACDTDTQRERRRAKRKG